MGPWPIGCRACEGMHRIMFEPIGSGILQDGTPSSNFTSTIGQRWIVAWASREGAAADSDFPAFAELTRATCSGVDGIMVLE
jgi:hypothetical protein